MSKKSKGHGRASKGQLVEFCPDAAGIDVHSEENWVAVPPDRCEESVRTFGSYTEDLHAIAVWLKECGVTTVAMESTGVYWIPLFQILESHGLEVFLVNARHVKNVPGRPKTDCLDCQWLRRLHACGLLTASFRPDDMTCRLRSLMRHREGVVKCQSQHIQRMQKALGEMNVLLHKVVSDITGRTGMRILHAILEGRRDLLCMCRELRDKQIAASPEEMARALNGDFRPEQLFVLGQELQFYEFIQERLTSCDVQIEQQLAAMEVQAPAVDEPAEPLTGAEKRRGNAPRFDIQRYLYDLTGVDLTRTPGIGAAGALGLISETGTDMTRWRNAGAFSAWASLCPNHRTSAGKTKSSRPCRSSSRVKHLFRQCASSLRRSPTALGAFFRRIRAHSGTSAAITATAHKLARLYYYSLRHRRHYVEMGQNYYDKRYHERMLRRLKSTAQRYGFRLEPAEETPQQESA